MNSSRKPSVSIHRRILLVFLISIALPGLYLSYVGLRSIVQEQELQRGLLVQNVERSLEFEIDRIEQRMEKSEEDVAQSLAVSNIPLIPPSLEQLNAAQSWIEQSFVFDSRLHLRSPPPFAADQPAQRAPSIDDTSLRSKIESAERLELRGDHAAAATSYQQLLAGPNSLQNRVTLNTYLARSADASGNRALARRAFEAVIEADSTFVIAQPIPYGAFARLEVIEDLVEQGNLTEALQGSIQFHERLLRFYYRLSSEQYQYFSNRLRSLRSSFASVFTTDSASRTALQSIDEQERLLQSLLGQAEEIESWLQTQRRVLSVVSSVGNVSHHSLSLGSRTVPISLILIGDSPAPRHWVVLVVRPENLQREFVLTQLQSGDLAEGFTVTLRSDSLQRAGEVELVSSPMRKTAALFPSSVISVSAKQTTTISIFGVELSILSVGVAVFIVAIILLGIFIIYHDIRREEELSAMKSEFISNVSHELKTPVAAIRMLSDNLRQHRVTDEPRKSEYYELISKESARLSHLLDNILDFSRIEGKRKAFQLERVDLGAIVRETVRQFRSLVEDHAQRITVDVEEGLPELLVDPDAIALALFNLLDNAAKYSEKESRIDVRCLKVGSFLSINVTDYGIGIAKPDQTKIFEKFYRVHRTEGKKIPGSGIGLTLVHEVAEAHKGRVELQSEPGAGSTFRVLLPIGG